MTSQARVYFPLIVKIIGIIIFLLLLIRCSLYKEPIVIDESAQRDTVKQMIFIDSVWSAHPVGFSLYTTENKQYVAYYNSERHIVVGQRNLEDTSFRTYKIPPRTTAEGNGTTTILGWDSHNYLTMAVDRDGFIHLAGNMHGHPITYFKSEEPEDISTLKQHFSLVGTNEDVCTYPRFMITLEGDLVFHYREGQSGDGQEIYDIYSTENQKWRRMLDKPLTDGLGKMNAYQSQPELKEDGWYHVYWVWRDSWDCSTNHDLSYMKSKDLQAWFDVNNDSVELPATADKKVLIVDPIPINGGIINLAALLLLDNSKCPVFVYHKFDNGGNTQLYIARFVDRQWQCHAITNWDYRWEFSGFGSINSEILLKDFKARADGYYEVNCWHVKYGHGTILLDQDFQAVGEVIKSPSYESMLEIEGRFAGLEVRFAGDEGMSPDLNKRFILKWETLNRNQDQPREKPWPAPSKLYLYEFTQTK